MKKLTIKNIQVRKRVHRNCSLNEYSAKARVYISHDGESILEGFGSRAARPYTIYRKHVMPFVLAHLGYDGKFSWSKHAGCTMCPCSPGFILDDHRGYDVWVTITNCESTTNPQLADDRRAQLSAQL